MVIIEEAPSFKNTVKKFHSRQQEDLKVAIEAIRQNPHIGKIKSRSLRGIRTHKVGIGRCLTLIAYKIEGSGTIINLLAIGPHENFYRAISL